MKKYIVLFYLSVITIGFSQNPEIKSELPNVMPPSPTVAALMKFEEFPVSNYTGLPDLGIPIFSSTTKNKKVAINVSLKYHAGSNGANEIASDVGLGWSLNAGGSISRTVRSLPDEIIEGPERNSNGKYGIYHSSNRMYEVVNLLQNGLNTNTDQEIIREFYYESMEKGKYDTEQDLWQFNFMGKTGRFLVKKNEVTAQLEIVPLDSFTEKIEINYGGGNNIYGVNGFVVYDNNGIKYVFNVIETSVTNSFSDGDYLNFAMTSGPSKSVSYNSAFHLTEVFDTNGQLLIKFEYDDRVSIETAINSSETSSQLLYDPTVLLQKFNESPSCAGYMEPTFLVSHSQRKTITKKLKKIQVIGNGTIEFDFVKGREDTNLHHPDSSYVLKNIIIKNQKDRFVKRFGLNYEYSTILFKRMMLKEVEFLTEGSISYDKYQFEYHTTQANLNTITKDYWGFFTQNLTCISNHIYKEPNSEFSRIDLIKKVKYPTGGCAIFNFESNDFSYIGNFEIFELYPEYQYSRLPQNQEMTNSITVSFGGNNPNVFTLPVVTQTQILKIKPNITSAESEYKFLAFKKNNAIERILSCDEYCTNCIIEFSLEPGNTYSLLFSNVNNVSNSQNEITNVELDYYTTIQANSLKKFVRGAGNRIRKVGYFSEDIPSNYYDNQFNSILPVKEVSYDYTLFSDPQKSSGSLVYYRPVYKYFKAFRPCMECSHFSDDMILDHNKFTEDNMLSVKKTAGADVGYQNVRVVETGNGYTKYTYTSPIDFPQTGSSTIIQYPFNDTYPDHDTYRGQVLKEEVFNELGRKLKVTENAYTTDFFENVTGVKLFYINEGNGCPISKKWKTYNDYVNYIRQCAQNISDPNYTPRNGNTYNFVYHCVRINSNQTSEIGIGPGTTIILTDCPCFCYCGHPEEFISSVLINDAYGWTRLESKETKNYFYDASNTQSEVVTREFFEYNPLNKMIANHQVISPEGEETNTSYSYLTDPAVLAQNRIAEIERIEVQKNGELLQTSQIEYSNSFQGNASYLPQRILTAKGNQALASKVRYNRYDAYGNPLEVQQEDGMLIAYIWGYNHTQVVAKIENCSYQAIPANLITALHQATATGSELDVLTALDNLRNAPGLSQAMVTTVTHIPLVGMSTLTDPKGVRIKYHYDAMNRLEKVTDHFGNIVTENSYNYRP
jgi:hypothetical protein